MTYFEAQIRATALRIAVYAIKERMTDITHPFTDSVREEMIGILSPLEEELSYAEEKVFDLGPNNG